MDLASARIVKRVSKHIESVGGYDTNTQKEIQESAIGQVIGWFRDVFSSD